ncbi:hypothetical protein Cs7R123_76300 [Catellatospora sp. TT07R-123]|uniref:hypothetical protein n=1 Tax=Catellatospora sp. TT07R-123 TaxID=2733863 RepID=UPI001B2B922C|nr:hypothetical protein [Catellatospora sp. TT07R-123]GHJ50288.1 hypothetical protein Cs7R123_76300 [Catellatospora sp. TT07R-123]
MTGTDWNAVPMQTMWDWVNGRQLSPHYEQADGWKKASELAGLHRDRLKVYREKLAGIWRPEGSEAAKAFLTRLDELIASVENVGQVTGGNYAYAHDMPISIDEAKRKLKPIYDAYMKYLPASGPNPTRPSDLPSGEGTVDQYLAKKLAEARRIMADLGSSLVMAPYNMVKPAPYVPPGRGTVLDHGGDYGTPPAIVPPMIPPIMPIPPAVPPSSFTPTPVPMPGGPDLSGLNPTPPTTTVPVGGTPTTNPTLPPATGNPGLPPGVIGAPPMTGLPAGARPPVIGGVGTPLARGAGMPGGVIGGAPAAGAARAGGARPNPVGGMIGGGAPGAAGRGAAGARGTAGLGGPLGGAPGRPGQRRDGEGEDHEDPDTLWSVAQGVAPVLDAPEAPGPVDPGPAIGMYR